MAQQTINVGAAPNDGTGTPLRTAFQYTNSNFTELYTAVGPSGNNIVVPGTATITGDLTVNTNVLKVDSTNDRVGIGTATPGNTLHVIGGNAGQLLLDNGNQQYTQLLFQRNSALNTGGDILVDGTASTFNFRTLAANMPFVWYLSASAGSPTTAMTLNATGLGVGVASPTNKLDVNGNAAFTGFGINANPLNATSTSQRQARFQNTGGDFYLGIEGSTGGGFFSGSTAYAACLYNAANTPLQFFTNGTLRSTIDSSGNLGIGVTPSAWASGYKAIQGQIGGFALSNDNSSNNQFRLSSNAYFDTTDSRWEYYGTSTATAYEQRAGEHRFFNAVSGSANTEITFTQAMTLDASGRLLVGSAASGTSAGDGIVKLGTYGHCISQTGTSIASGSSVDLTIVTSGAGYQGFLSVANTQDASANTRTQTTYSVFGRGASATFTQIATANGSIGGATFTVTTPSNGVIRITNTSGAAATISAQFFGGASA